MITEVYLHTAAAVAPLLRSPALAARWAEPSVLAEFGVAGLAGHLARAVFTVEGYLDAEVPAGVPAVDAVTYFELGLGDAPADPGTALNRSIRARGEQDAGAGPTHLADRYDAARARLAGRLSAMPDDRPVAAGRFVLLLGECLVTRLVELLVHADDLAVSLDVDGPAFPDSATDVVVTTLARLSVRRHGGPAVLRALARRERATGPIAAF
jgi:hypothetical protein